MLHREEIHSRRSAPIKNLPIPQTTIKNPRPSKEKGPLWLAADGSHIFPPLGPIGQAFIQVVVGEQRAVIEVRFAPLRQVVGGARSAAAGQGWPIAC